MRESVCVSWASGEGKHPTFLLISFSDAEPSQKKRKTDLTTSHLKLVFAHLFLLPGKSFLSRSRNRSLLASYKKTFSFSFAELAPIKSRSPLPSFTRVNETLDLTDFFGPLFLVCLAEHKLIMFVAFATQGINQYWYPSSIPVLKKCVDLLKSGRGSYIGWKRAFFFVGDIWGSCCQTAENGRFFLKIS